MSKRHRAARQNQPPDPFLFLANQLRTVAAALADLIDQDAAAGSIGATDAEDRRWTGLGATRPALEATLLPKQLLGLTIDQLRGTAACAAADGVLFSILSLLRPLVDATASAYFLLDPDIDTQERARRWANYRLESLVERLRMADSETPEALSIAARIDRLKERAIELRFACASATGFRGP
jgi:hypothetical protein